MARSGKDTLADELVKIGYEKLSLAEPIKKGLAIMLPHIEFTDNKEEIIPELGVSYRYLLQTLGTEWGRDTIKESIWLDTLLKSRTSNNSVIADCRFLNEVEAIRELNGIIVKVDASDRLGNEDFRKHSSENQLNSFSPDYIIENNSTLEDFQTEIKRFLENL